MQIFAKTFAEFKHTFGYYSKMASSGEVSVSLTELSHSNPASYTNSSVSDTTEEERPAFENGQMIDEKFLVCKKINEGGFGAVYEVALPSVSVFD